MYSHTSLLVILVTCHSDTCHSDTCHSDTCHSDTCHSDTCHIDIYSIFQSAGQQQEDYFI